MGTTQPLLEKSDGSFPVAGEEIGRRILIASSSAEFRQQMAARLRPRERHLEEAQGGADALLKLEAGKFAALYLDRNLNDLYFDDVLSIVRAQYPQVEVVTVDSAREGRAPAEEDRAEAEAAIAGEANGEAPPAASAQPAEGAGHPERIEERPAPELPGMIGTNRLMRRVYRLARLVAARDTAVLLIGDTGTGKELVARGIHQMSPRAKQPIVVVNCAAIPEALLEAELFGYARGAFTGAFQSRIGRIHAAQGGTLLLDEVGELPLSVQAKLLRFVQEGEVQRLGCSDVFRVDVRLICATNADLLQCVNERKFREDLYYRLAVFPVEIPPLRQRPEDVLPLAQHFLDLLCRKCGAPFKRFSPEAAVQLRENSWPGNVRQLNNVVERAFVISEEEEVITPHHLWTHPAAA
jgi:transcriptional regulator with GAF, ATPase, and Fis domain